MTSKENKENPVDPDQGADYPQPPASPRRLNKRKRRSFGLRLTSESESSDVRSLQDQLLAAMMENDKLVEELNVMDTSEIQKSIHVGVTDKNAKLSENKEEDKDLSAAAEDEAERSPNELLSRRRNKSKFSFRRKGPNDSPFLSVPSNDAEESTESGTEDATRNRSRSPFVGPFKESFLDAFSGLVEDFSVVADETASPESADEELSVKKLKDNVLRFNNVLGPISSALDYLQLLMRWKSPAASFIAMGFYVGVLWKGYAVTVLLITLIVHVAVNYLKKSPWTFRLFCVANQEKMPSTEVDETNLKETFIIVLQVARKVQNVLGYISDAAEKINNVLNWEHESTSTVFLILWVLLLGSLYLTPSKVCTLIGFYLGFKLFLIDFIFSKYPRIKRKYDSTSYWWNSLPTNADLERKNPKVESSPQDIFTFLQSFGLPPKEIPLAGFQGGRRCTLVNREKSLTSAYKTGRLYLTNNYLCFERSKTNPEKNIKFLVSEITGLEKATSYGWIPGSGMALEVSTNGKAFFFAGILNRDEVYDAILDRMNQRETPKDSKSLDSLSVTIPESRRGSNVSQNNGSDLKY